MKILNIDRQLVTVRLNVPECAALAQACNVQSLETDGDDALTHALGAAFQGLGMAATTLDLLHLEIGDDLLAHWQNYGLMPEE